MPAPGATKGFQDNLDDGLAHFFASAVTHFLDFFAGFATWPEIGKDRAVLAAGARDRYVHHYLGLASTVPEFGIWAFLGEHSATRDAIRESDAALRGALVVQTESLERLHRLLALGTPLIRGPVRSYREKLETIARAALDKPLLRSSRATSTKARFPTVERGFVAPAYRLAVYQEKSEPSSETWWQETTEVAEDIDTFFAAHLSTTDSTVRPLLVLGHPGAGKSLLMTVLAARLPGAGYAVVTVQLRKVHAEDGVRRQIEAALHDELSERVDWGRLADECADSIRVVLLDGFDELVQASGVTQSAYLQQVRDFQEREADLGRPVAVVITSRTLVVDRARIPDGVPIVKLEEFDNGRVGKWIDAWNTANASSPEFRTFEFLHATFSEYLIADLSLALLRDLVAEKRFRETRVLDDGAVLPDDALLFALISHQPFTKRNPVLDFAAGLFAGYDRETQAGLLEVLGDLVRSFHERAKSDHFPAYSPAGLTLVSRVATYSANLVCLRVALENGSTTVAELLGTEEGDLTARRSTVRLRRAGLDEEGWLSLVDGLTLVQGDTWHISREVPDGTPRIREARLLGDPVLEGSLRGGNALAGTDVTSDANEQSLLDRVAQWITSPLARPDYPHSSSLTSASSETYSRSWTTECD
ncbi:ATP-binding protein [Actinosynnema sp. NPDC020468]|uniref:NACHT domain-containing protein n=1 Tax=Actinosynnema sp. NPDC020468 TaxID=3154488 RepID=UPI0033D61170